MHPPHVEHATSSTRAGLIFFKSLFGAGILALPSAMNTVGFKLSIIIYFIVSVGCIITCYALLRAKEIVEERVVPKLQINTYEDLVEAVVNKSAAKAVRYMIVALDLCFCCGFIIAVNENLMNVFENRGLENWHIGVGLLPVLILLNSCQFLHKLWIVAFVGLITYFGGVIGTSMWYVSTNWVPNDEFLRAWDLGDIPKFSGCAVYALEGILCVLPVQRTMKNQNEAIKVIVYLSLPAYAIVTMSYALVAAAGGLAVNVETGKSCDIVTECFKEGSMTDVLRVALAGALVATHPITLYGAIEMLEFMLMEEEEVKKAEKVDKEMLLFEYKIGGKQTPRPRYALRAAMVTITVVFGCSLKSFTTFSNIVGGIGLTFVGFVVPAHLFWKTHEKFGLVLSWYSKFLCCLCYIFGLFNALYSGVISNF